jgi:putative peptide zinc metalloprotease protein
VSDELGRSPLPSHPEDLRLRPGTELLGHYEDSAFEQPTYLVRRQDGQVIHLSQLLYLVLLLIDGSRNLADIARTLSDQLGRQVVPANVEYLVENKLRPLGLLASTADDAQPLTRSLPLLALRYRTRVIPPRLHRGASMALRPLFWPPVILVVLAGLLALDGWLFGTNGSVLARAARQLPFHPNLLLLVTLFVIFSGFFHEIGHATATRYGGGSPGVMGVGIYIAWPAFYTDLTDSYRLDRRSRLRADLGGVYFNAVLIVVAGVAYLATGFTPLVVFVVVSQSMALYQFLPFIRMDGYYIMSDLIGVPNLFAYLRPVLASLFRRPDPLTSAWLERIKPRARRVIKVWSVVTVLFLVFNFGGLALLAPILIPAEWTAVHLQAQVTVEAFSKGDVAAALNDLFSLLLVAIAPLGMILITVIVLRRACAAIRRWWSARPVVAVAAGALLASALLFQGHTLVARLVPSHRPTVVAAAHGGHPHVPAHADRGVLVVPPTPPAPSPSSALVAVPSAPVRIYVVQPGDTLWSIAAQQLGDPEQWRAIYTLNAGLPQPDGRTLADPGLIIPGWRLELPGTQPVTASITNASRPAGVSGAVLVGFDRAPPGQTGAVAATVIPASASVTPTEGPTVSATSAPLVNDGPPTSTAPGAGGSPPPGSSGPPTGSPGPAGGAGPPSTGGGPGTPGTRGPGGRPPGGGGVGVDATPPGSPGRVAPDGQPGPAAGAGGSSLGSSLGSLVARAEPPIPSSALPLPTPTSTVGTAVPTSAPGGAGVADEVSDGSPSTGGPGLRGPPPAPVTAPGGA